MNTTNDTNAENSRLLHQIAVMQAFAAGKKVEITDAFQTNWEPAPAPYWDWSNYDYRIAPTIASGHNPDQLTEEQVEVDKGWRLLEPGEIQERPVTADIQMWVDNWTTFHASGSVKAYTYRTLRPPGYFLPKTRRIGPDDWKDHPTIWVRYGNGSSLVTDIQPSSFVAGGQFYGWDSHDRTEWSPDRKNWYPFTVNE